MTAYLGKSFSVACSSGGINSDEAQARWDATFGKRDTAQSAPDGPLTVAPSDSQAPRGDVGGAAPAPSASPHYCARPGSIQTAYDENATGAHCIHADTGDSECDDCALECEWARNDDDPIWIEGEGEYR